MNRRLLAPALLCTVVAGCGGGEPSFPPGTPAAVEEVVTLPDATWSMASDTRSLWVQVGDTGAARIELESGDVGATVPDVQGMIFANDRLWASTGGAVLELDPVSGETVRRSPLPRLSGFLAFGDGAVWAYRWSADATGVESVLEIDPLTLRVVSEVPVSDCEEARGIAYAFETVWIACKDSDHVLRVVPGKNRVVATIPTGQGPHHLAEGAGSMWVTNYRDNTVSRIDPAANEVVATVPDVGAGIGIASVDGGIWGAGTEGLGRIDPVSNRVDEVIPLDPLLVPRGDYYYEIVPVEASLWVSTVGRGQAAPAGGEVWRVELP